MDSVNFLPLTAEHEIKTIDIGPNQTIIFYYYNGIYIMEIVSYFFNNKKVVSKEDYQNTCKFYHQ